MKKSLILIIFLPVFLFSSWSADSKKIVFKWSIFKKINETSYESIEANGNEKHKEGDQFKIYVKPIENVYIYIYSLDSENSLDLVFPKNGDFFKKYYKMNDAYFLPDEDGWYEITGKGTEKFYLLASYERLKKIESLTKTYLKLIDNQSNKKFAEAKMELLNEIDSTRKQYSQFKVYAEKPTSIAGVSRSLEAKIKQLAIHVEADKFYGKIIRLEH